eukprot:CAMPEP_0177671240 /NCGR_PEP_ID=MMETSP0447-20121125/24587_1 /TAXON_ID=0 /ORGANISM="Stygamoeba regulata, Strain BSH-02190019" /LENGTH=411 /DNA_ID=CAMNT_0019178597 /DNA_START=69 /DNA_END=1301 /DNA_ORIENTATION=+
MRAWAAAMPLPPAVGPRALRSTLQRRSLSSKYHAEPFRIKSVEPIFLKDQPEREQALSRARFNLFKLKSEDVYVDLLTDSGTGAMSNKQWASIMMGDESYAGAKSFHTLAAGVERVTGFTQFVPCHQGRAAENILATVLVRPGQVVPSNMHFDTTSANIQARGGTPLNFPDAHIFDATSSSLFKGNLDVTKLSDFIKEVGALNIPFGMITITNNRAAGSPVSLENIRAVSQLYRKHSIPFYIDAARFAENSFFIQRREDGYRHRSVPSIAREIFDLADGFTFSAKKDAIVNIGGLLATRDPSVFEGFTNELILREGFVSYGGLAGRDLEAMAVGLEEGMDEAYLDYRVGQVEYLGEGLRAAGVPVVTPFGGHAVFIDAGRLLPHIPPSEFPGQALAVELYREGGVRACEIG